MIFQGGKLMSRPSFFVFLVLISTSVPLRAAEPFRYPEGKHARGELRYINGLPVLMVEGTPTEIGDQIATLTASPARRMLKYPYEMLEHYLGKVVTKVLWP